MTAPFVITSRQISHENIAESPISKQEEYSDGEDQESEEEELAISTIKSRKLHVPEESIAIDHLPPDAHTLVEEWFTERLQNKRSTLA
jgi:hypothetical protein